MPGQSLYGKRDHSKSEVKNTSSSSSLAFSTELASLISKDLARTKVTSANTLPGGPRPSKLKDDIFTQHNRNSKKRGAADSTDDIGRRHKTQVDIGAVDDAALQRSKRRMEEKAQIYTAMKRGDYIRPDDARDERTLVDFDRKWAEQMANGKESEESSASETDSDQEEGHRGGDAELVEYEDELGRHRRGTKAQVAREERRKRIQAIAAEEEERFSARPQEPTNVIYGDTIQHNAFNPDDVTIEKMTSLASRRDRSATPPQDAHYNANAEIRTKGTGFYNFSQDAEQRKQEMNSLDRERIQTERERKEKEKRKQNKQHEIEERRKKISEHRGKVRADRFLADLDLPSIPTD